MPRNRTNDVSIPPGNVREESVNLSTGSRNRITIMGPPRGTIWARLMDYEQIEPLAELEYTIELSREELTGTTDEEGVLRHEEVIIGYYTLSAGEDQTTVFAEIEPGEPAIVRMPFTEAPDEVYFSDESDDLQLQTGISDDDELDIPEEPEHG